MSCPDPIPRPSWVRILFKAPLDGWGVVGVTAFRQARRVVVLVVGVTVMLFGVALIFLPGPAFVVIPAGLAILATEFVWARRILKRLKDGAISAYNAATGAEQANPQDGKDDDEA